MYDIIVIGDNVNWDNLKKRFPTAKRAKTLDQAFKKSFTKFFWCVWDDLIVDANFNFDYVPDSGSQDYIHVFKNGEYYDGICLFSKTAKFSKREVDFRFFVNKKEVDIVASNPKPYDKFYINTYQEYLNATEESSSDMFWVVWNDLEVLDSFNFNYFIPAYDTFHRNITHVFKNGNHYDGICLFSKTKIVSKKEFEYRFFTEKNEVDIVASNPKPYDKFYINTYEEYLEIIKKSSSNMIWIIPNDVTLSDNFNFNYFVPIYDTFHRNIIHIFKNGKYYDGIFLIPKNLIVSKKEFDYRYFANKKEVDIVASDPKRFDIVFISYNEPNADKNWNDLITKAPNAKRIHGVKGIHNAHIAAANLVTTPMFWVVDGDAKIADDFNFDYQVPVHNYDSVYVWKSKNPINKLEYGYGGVKLLPKKKTQTVDVSSTDMTTSISSKFNPVNQVSNITMFNTDAFSTWKSAFRECVKLSSYAINRQDSKETDERLHIWCTEGKESEFGEYAIAGAIAGSLYGKQNKNNVDNLKKINDFDWLKDEFKKHFPNIL